MTIEKRLERIETMLEKIVLSLGSMPGQVAAQHEQPGMSHQSAALIALARVSPADAIAEAKRLSRLDTAGRRRKEQ